MIRKQVKIKEVLRPVIAMIAANAIVLTLWTIPAIAATGYSLFDILFLVICSVTAFIYRYREQGGRQSVSARAFVHDTSWVFHILSIHHLIANRGFFRGLHDAAMVLVTGF